MAIAESRFSLISVAAGASRCAHRYLSPNSAPRPRLYRRRPGGRRWSSGARRAVHHRVKMVASPGRHRRRPALRGLPAGRPLVGLVRARGHIRRSGDDVRAGDEIVPAGRRVTAALTAAAPRSPNLSNGGAGACCAGDMTSAWDTAGTPPVRPPDDLDDHDVVVTDQGTYWECGFTDWHLLLGWYAGTETLMRYPDNREQWSTVLKTDAAGNQRISRRRVGDEERREADADINQHLDERVYPHGRTVSAGTAGRDGSDVTAAYVRVQSELPGRYDVLRETEYARAAVEQLYGLPVTPRSSSVLASTPGP